MFEMLVCVSKNMPAITAFITARKKKCNQKLNNEQLSWSFERKQKPTLIVISLFALLLHTLLANFFWAPLGSFGLF